MTPINPRPQWRRDSDLWRETTNSKRELLVCPRGKVRGSVVPYVPLQDPGVWQFWRYYSETLNRDVADLTSI